LNPSYSEIHQPSLVFEVSALLHEILEDSIKAENQLCL